MGIVALYRAEPGAGRPGDRSGILDVVQCGRPLRGGTRLDVASNQTVAVTMGFSQLASISESEGKPVPVSRDPFVDPHWAPTRNCGVRARTGAVDTATLGPAKTWPPTPTHR
jgi:hypothetical protein